MCYTMAASGMILPVDRVPFAEAQLYQIQQLYTPNNSTNLTTRA